MQIQGETSVNKLIVLFVFDKMESALSERTIVEMCTSSNPWLNYMDCMELLPRLLDDGFICRLPSPDDEPMYSITTDGRESLNNFYINIPKSIREEISVFVKKNSGKLPFRERSLLDFGEDGITEISGNYSETVPYSSITSIVRSDNRLFVFTDGDNGFVIPFDDAAKNGRKVAKLLSQKTGLEVEEDSADR
jgi:hypothetical protein